MSDPNYWKNRYEQTWEQSKSREENIVSLITQETGFSVRLIGLGAGSADYISGSAASHGYERGGADLEVVGTNLRLEVTGPLVQSVRQDADLWVRPDKITTARGHYPTFETWVIHHLPATNLLRIIPLNESFFISLDRKEFSLAHPFIRGVRETYYCIPAKHRCVQSWQSLLDRLMT